MDLVLRTASEIEAERKHRKATNTPAYPYAHMCRDGHVMIGHNDSEHEQCPLCRARDTVRAEMLTDENLMAAAKAICQHDNDLPLCDEVTMRGCCLPKARAALSAADGANK